MVNRVVSAAILLTSLLPSPHHVDFLRHSSSRFVVPEVPSDGKRLTVIAKLARFPAAVAHGIVSARLAFQEGPSAPYSEAVAPAGYAIRSQC